MYKASIFRQDLRDERNNVAKIYAGEGAHEMHEEFITLKAFSKEILKLADIAPATNVYVDLQGELNADLYLQRLDKWLVMFSYTEEGQRKWILQENLDTPDGDIRYIVDGGTFRQLTRSLRKEIKA